MKGRKKQVDIKHTPEDYTKDKFLKDLKRVSKPVRRQNYKRKSSSGRT